ncbi:uncharacterized protein HLK63_C01705 [Nakaseomyces glabratus]|nr:uncharacterized protein GW608_C01705 [Nakaseomyces glabratus]UCS24454.1 uncharacterized protein HLK63_C01705 [Nakaseomyces glabratus]UCS29684.1 uncharacterized protein HLK64_C01705 [Nakaseomyces glabratus]UCS34913.1 uncharacterized protein HLK62_C01705 [Nakaseomyces glabratus]
MVPVYVCVNEYRRRMEDEIDMKPGDKIEVLMDDGEYKDGWYQGKNLRTAQVGLYPAVFTQPIGHTTRTTAKSDRRVPTPKLDHGNFVDTRMSGAGGHAVGAVGAVGAETPPLSASSVATSAVHSTLNDIDLALAELRKDSVTLSQPPQVSGESLPPTPVSRDSGAGFAAGNPVSHGHASHSVPLSRDRIIAWAPKDVAEYMLSRGFDFTTASKFQKHQITGIILLEMQTNMLKEIEISSFGIRFELEKEINHLRSVVYNSSTPRLHSNNWDGSRSASQNTNRDSVLISPPSQMVSSQTEKPYRSLDNLQNPARIRKSSTSNRPASTIISSESYNRRPSEIHSLSSRVPTGGLSVPGSNNSSNPNFNPALYAVPVDEILKDGTIFESPGRAPKPPSYPSPVQPPQSPMAKPNKGNSPYMVAPPKFESRTPSLASSASLVNSSNSILTSSSDLGNNSSKFKFPANQNDKVSGLLAPSKEISPSLEMDGLSGRTSSSGTRDVALGDSDTPINLPNHSRKSSGLKRNSVVYKTHKKSESGGSFVELFNRISMLSPGKDEDPINGHKRSASSATYQSHTHRRSASNATIQHHSRNSSQNLNHMRQPSIDEQRHRRNSSQNLAHMRQPSMDGARHRRNSSRLSFFGGKGDNLLQTLSPNVLTSQSHSRKGSYITSPFKQQFTDAVTNLESPTANSNGILSPSKAKSPQKFTSPLKSTPNTTKHDDKKTGEKPLVHKNRIDNILKDEEEKKRSVSETAVKDKSSRLARPIRPANNKQQTSAFQEGLRSITVQEAMKTADCSGWMSKKGSGPMGTWKERFFVLHGTRLSYFASVNDTKERGLIDITAHRVVPANEDDKLVALYAASVGKGRFCIKLLPPQPGSKKGLTFTQPKIHYLAVETKDEMRAWLSALIKATIDFDTSVPVISSYATPTVSLSKAKEMLSEARKLTQERDNERRFDETDEDKLYWEEQLQQNSSSSLADSKKLDQFGQEYF